MIVPKEKFSHKFQCDLLFATNSTHVVVVHKCVSLKDVPPKFSLAIHPT